MKEKLVYLRFVILGEGLKMGPKKVQAIHDWPTPVIVGKVRSFHGLARFYRKFIRNFSLVCNAMPKTMRGDKKDFKWTQGENKS